MKPAEADRPAYAESGGGELDEIRESLSRTPRELPSRWLYDALGSTLFEAICLLPWYRITRAEMQLLSAHAGEIARTVAPGELVELGCGNGQKLVTLVRARLAEPAPLHIYLIDVSAEAIDATTTALRAAGAHDIRPIQASYQEGLLRVPSPSSAPRLVLFLGSNIGNFDPAEAAAFAGRIRAVLRPGEWLLLGVDLVKPEPELLLAYDDPLGLTAAFNRNLLLHLNAAFGANFDIEGFRHRAVWNAEASRIEMHLVSLRRQRVTLPGTPAPLYVTLEEGESIWTESSYKYAPESFRRLIESAGFGRRSEWIDRDAQFLLALFQAG